MVLVTINFGFSTWILVDPKFYDGPHTIQARCPAPPPGPACQPEPPPPCLRCCCTAAAALGLTHWPVIQVLVTNTLLAAAKLRLECATSSNSHFNNLAISCVQLEPVSYNVIDMVRYFKRSGPHLSSMSSLLFTGARSVKGTVDRRRSTT